MRATSLSAGRSLLARSPRIVASGLIALIAAAIAVAVLATQADGTTTTLYNNITGYPATSGANAGRVDSGFRTAQPFTATASGTPNLVGVWVQCVGIGCEGVGRIEIVNDNAGAPGGSVLGTGEFQATDATGAEPECTTMTGALPIAAGSRYWAVMSSTGSDFGWLAQTDAASGALESSDGGATWRTAFVNKTYSLRVEEGQGCTPDAAPLPAPGDTIDHLFANPAGGTGFNTIFIGNDGTASLVLQSGTFTGPNASDFSVLDGEPGPLAHPFPFPRAIAAQPGAGRILYVVCTGNQPQGFRHATFTVTTNDPDEASLSWPVTCLVDGTPPTIEYTQSPNGLAGWWTSPTATLTVRGVDPESNNFVKLIRCLDDNGPTLTGTASVYLAPVTGEGVHNLSCQATDAANNVSTPYLTVVKVDSRPPVIAGTRTPAANAAGWNNTDTVVTFACADPVPGSGKASDTVAGGGSYTAETAGTTSTSTGACADIAGHDAAAPVSLIVKIDRTKPVLSPGQTPPANAAGWNRTNVTVSFPCADTGDVQSGFASSTVPSPVISTDTPFAGSIVTSTGTCLDVAGNAALAETHLVKLDKTPPPAPEITSAPAAIAATSSASFAFTGSDGLSGVDRYECGLAGAFAPCTSPKLSADLSDGLHTFSVRTVDVAGNTGPAESLTWRVDTTPPASTIDSAPPAVTADSSATFTFSATDVGGSGVETLTCTLDGVAGDCTSPAVHSGLAAGVHTFSVFATDAAGHVESVPASSAWTVDQSPPVTTLMSAPPAVTSETTATFRWTAVDSGGSSVAGFECRREGGDWEPCTTPATYSDLVEGLHHFSVRARDLVGNVESFYPSATWTIAFAPTTVDDSAGTLEDTSAAIDVLVNDTGPSGQLLQVASVDATTVAGGSATATTAGVLYQPPANFSGIDTFTYTAAYPGSQASLPATVTVSVSPLNDAPTFSLADVTVAEDSAPYTAPWASSVSAGPPDESGQDLAFAVTGSTNPGLFSVAPSVGADGALGFTPAADANGSSVITVSLTDDGGGTDSTSHTATITVTSVNDAPSFGSPDVTVAEDSGSFAAPWASGLSAGPPDESDQSLAFAVTGSTNPGLFSVAPSVGGDGALGFTPAADASGSSVITVSVTDDGGGTDSASHTATITVTSVNDAPSFSVSDVSVAEDSGGYAAAWATEMSAGPADEAGQQLTLSVTGSSNPALFSVVPAVATDGSLSFTSAPDANGSGTVTVTLSDDGGGTGTTRHVATITVQGVNDAPGFVAPDVTVAEDSGPYSAPWATGVTAGAANESGQALTFSVTGTTNAALFSVPPSVAGDGSLSFTPAANASGSSTVTVSLTDDGGTAGGGSDSTTHTATVNVTAVNDAPTVVLVAGGVCSSDPSPPMGTLHLVLGDIDDDVASLTLSGQTSSAAVVAASSVTFAGSGANRTVTAVTRSKAGTAVVTVTVSDGSGSAAVAFTVIVGTKGSETINGTTGVDLLFGVAGTNVINAGDGDDVVCGGTGSDTISGGAGSDVLNGEKGNDAINGGAGDDVLIGGAGTDALAGQDGHDSLTGGTGIDSFSGGAGADVNADLSAKQGDTWDGS